jgi:RHH-type proline utilization regulon transcriptional repressor/proline dehydrogenase/delta 1-pyrroline-5-carboxylate dehydrogenase
VARSLDDEVTALAKRIAELGSGEQARVYNMSWWSERMLGWAMSHPSFKTQLFRFVDVFPATHGDDDVLRHVQEYFDGPDVPRMLDLGMGLAGHMPFGDSLTASVARHNIARMAQQFIVGSSPVEAVAGLRQLWRVGSGFVVDLLGEKTVTEAQAGRYAQRVVELVTTLVRATASWPPDDHLERDDLGPLPRVAVSLKPTALATRYTPLTRADGLASAKGRLRPLLKLCATEGVFAWFDMEHFDAKDLTLQLFQDLLGEPELSELQAGCVIQAYTRDGFGDLADLVVWSAGRVRHGSPPVGVRLVKGAYWDAETVHARAAGWPSPVFTTKGETDANFERCARLLHDHHGQVRSAFASHNLRSLAYAVTYGRSLGIPDSGYELQMLYGMAEPVQAAIRRLGLRLRIYAPVGELVPGMAYLVRRLLENTSNESFVRRRFAEGLELEELLQPPDVEELPGPPPPVRRPPTDEAAPGPYWPEPVAEWRRAAVRAAMGTAVLNADPDGPGPSPRRRSSHPGPAVVPAVIGGQRVSTGHSIESVDPARPSVVLATSTVCGAAEADQAVEACRKAWPQWRDTPARGRAAVLFGAAEWLRSRRMELAALEVFEAGKPWADADADVCEAIDFCEYYGRQVLRLDEGGEVQSPPGEANALRYHARGVGAVISPWNFPLAIPTGMVSAALVTGNAVCFKPAEQTPAIAFRLVEAFAAAGLPDDVLAFLPGYGEAVGARLVEHPGISFVVFTGSKAVGLGIVEAAAHHRPGQAQVKRVVAEMGGKNPLIVDADADLDEAVPAIVSSTFGYSGQKCSALSRLIVLDAVYDELLERLVGATAVLRIGHPRSEGVDIGPLIDPEAHQRVRSYRELAPSEGRVVLQRDDVPDEGWFAGPTIVDGVDPSGRLAREEIFGPVLCVFRAGDLDEAITLANDTDYALTGGVFSRSPATIRRAAAELRAGNLYINRGITGAVVGRQPFGGFGLSGVGSKAGGPDYLFQFVDPRVMTENTLRQGFAPEG